jgi:hypothetical protein
MVEHHLVTVVGAGSSPVGLTYRLDSLSLGLFSAGVKAARLSLVQTVGVRILGGELVKQCVGPGRQERL